MKPKKHWLCRLRLHWLIRERITAGRWCPRCGDIKR